ncbi:hypothetical protein ECANGB1_1051 [Enterospora canceri]|uniref:Uncharacterized protein n=1 Tax=Enterospora canceri TaxID=1081671 RepID=A0A1Y1S6S2_9MICR|nr:hypothetical protein ECANGB1_1051 [Enterospora canceri]
MITVTPGILLLLQIIACIEMGYLQRVDKGDYLGEDLKFTPKENKGLVLRIVKMVLDKKNIEELVDLESSESEIISKDDIVGFVTKKDNYLSVAGRSFRLSKYKRRGNGRMFNLPSNAMVHFNGNKTAFQMIAARKPNTFILANKDQYVVVKNQKLSLTETKKKAQVFKMARVKSKDIESEESSEESEEDRKKKKKRKRDESTEEEESEEESEEERESTGKRGKDKKDPRKKTQLPEPTDNLNRHVDNLKKTHNEMVNKIQEGLKSREKSEKVQKELDKAKEELAALKKELDEAKKSDKEKEKELENLKKEVERLEKKTKEADEKKDKDKMKEGSDENDSSEPERKHKKGRKHKKRVYEAYKDKEGSSNSSSETSDECDGMMDRNYGCIQSPQLGYQQPQMPYNSPITMPYSPQSIQPGQFVPNSDSVGKAITNLTNLMHHNNGGGNGFQQQQQPDVDCTHPITLEDECYKSRKKGRKHKSKRRNKTVNCPGYGMPIPHNKECMPYNNNPMMQYMQQPHTHF